MRVLILLHLVRATLPSHAAAPLKNEFLAFYRDAVLNTLYNDFSGAMDGRTWPPGAIAQTMAGVRRADNVAALVAAAVEDGVEGSFIETGVWKGGLSFLAAKTFEILGERSRLTYLADSFGGIPPPPKDGQHYNHQDRIASGHKFTILKNNSAVAVQQAARRFHLRDEQLRFVVGFFNESIPRLVAAEPDVRFAVVRLDGDTYFSTMDAIKHLYPRLQPGGFLIIDDYTEWQGCTKAVLDYRRQHGITEPITVVPHRIPEWTIGAYWRKGSTSNSSSSSPSASSSTSSTTSGVGAGPMWPTCVPAEGTLTRGGKPVVRAAGSYLPQTLREMDVSDMHRSSATRTISLPFNSDMKNGNALIETVFRGEKLHFCV